MMNLSGLNYHLLTREETNQKDVKVDKGISRNSKCILNLDS